MAQRSLRESATEPARERPVVHDVDVAIAGSGISGTFAAIAAGRLGAETLVIERFGALGGNIGPAMIWGGTLDAEAAGTLPGGLAGISKEFLSRLDTLLGDTPRNYANLSSTCSRLAYDMMREAGVELMLSAYASDPIVQDGLVQGLFVESASGRVAVRAKVTVDATGVASLAARAGAPIFRHIPAQESFAPIVRPNYLKSEYPKWNEAGLVSLVAGVDFDRYHAFEGWQAEPSEDDARWAEERGLRGQNPLYALLRQAYERGEGDPCLPLAPQMHVSVIVPAIATRAGPRTLDDYRGGIGSIRLGAFGAIDIDDAEQVTLLETGLRARAHELVQIMAKYVPGCEGAYVLFTAPFIGTRGGPWIDAEHVLTPEESIRGARFDDVIYVNIHEALHGGASGGFDVPYRMLLPKGVDGLLVTGRGAGYQRRGHDPSGMRARPSMMVLGETTGAAAALCARRGESPKSLEVRELQRQLVEQGLHLGDRARLAALGIA